MIQCDDECPPQPWLGAALIGAAATLAAAAVGPVIAAVVEGRRERRAEARALGRLEGLLGVVGLEDDASEDEDE